MKKKPLVTVSCAHGKLSTSNHTNENLTNGGSEVSSKEQWISSVCALQFSDLIATGMPLNRTLNIYKLCTKVS